MQTDRIENAIQSGKLSTRLEHELFFLQFMEDPMSAYFDYFAEGNPSSWPSDPEDRHFIHMRLGVSDGHELHLYHSRLEYLLDLIPHFDKFDYAY